MDEFELAGFDEETCEQLRKISFESGIEPERLICIARQYQTDPLEPLGEFSRLGIAWDIFKEKLSDIYESSKIKMLADKFVAWLERFIK